MDEGGTVSILRRKELRKQKLMEYLAAKGKLKPPNPKSYVHDDCLVKKPAMSRLKSAMDKENNTPNAIRVGNQDTKVQPQAAKTTSQSSSYGQIKKKSVHKGDILPGARSAVRLVTSSGPTQQKLNHIPASTRKYTVAPLKSNLSATNHPKRQPNTAVKHAAHLSSGKSLSNAIHKTTSQPNNKPSSGTDRARLGPNKTNNARMSLGPIVKTKTGLIPAAVQPRVHSSTALSASVSQRSTTAQRKTLPTTSVNKPVQKRATATGTTSAGIKIQAQSKPNSKPPLDKLLQPSFKNQLPSGRKSACVSSMHTAVPVKPNDKRILKIDKPVIQPSKKTAQQRSEVEQGAKGRPCAVVSRASSRPASRCSSRTVNRARQDAAAELGEKAKAHNRTDNKKGGDSTKVPPPPRTGTKSTGIPSVPQTVPRFARTSSQAGQATDVKTPKAPARVVPQTEGKKLTAVQEERMKKLQEWREAKGIFYKRPPMPVKPQRRRTTALTQPYWVTMKEEDEAHSLVFAVDRSLADGIKLLEEGCPPDQVMEVLSRLPTVAQKFAKYWICRVRLMELQGNLDVLPMFEEAVHVVLEPVDELRTVVFEILKKRDEIQGHSSVSVKAGKEPDQTPEPGDSTPALTHDPVMTPKPVRALICGEKGDSSLVKYKITATPGGLRSQPREPARARVNGQEVRFFTPVKRSVRIQRASLHYPAFLQDHDLCVASYDDLIAEAENETCGEQGGKETGPSAAHDTPMYIYRENEALKDQVSVQLVYDDE